MTKPLRLTFGPTGQDPVKLLTEDGRDLAEELPIAGLSVELGSYDSEVRVVFRLDSIEVDAQAYEGQCHSATRAASETPPEE